MQSFVRPVILMRPGAANDRLAGRLNNLGMNVWKWPAFTILPPEDSERVQQRLNHLECFDMVMLASPAAVAAAAVHVRKWPEHITLATIGQGTARAIRAVWGEDTHIVAPAGDSTDSGSEKLFQILKEQGFPARVLIVRGQVGREWLREQLIAHGTDVEVLPAYQRAPLELTTEQLSQLRSSLMGPSPIIYVTSTDAVGVLLHAVKGIRGAREWILKGDAITIHPRPQAQLVDVGFVNPGIVSAKDVEVTEEILKRLNQAKF
ncbi:MAG: uroporphyrinogen-III synthase [Burkholderiaceae bacterium]|nr:uroporphyrinogen-III synthase [Burkholderiaceae bacterium]